MYLEKHLQLLGRPDIEPFVAYLLMSHFLDYHILYHHNQGEVEQSIYKSLVRIYVGGEKISV